jgi:hypothetical protein
VIIRTFDAGVVGLRDRVAGLGPGRVDDADEGHELEALDQRQEVGVRVERRGVEVLLRRRQDPETQLAVALVLGHVGLAAVLDVDFLALGPTAELARARSWSGAPLT